MFKRMSKQEKIAYSKQFTLAERKAYRKGKRNGYLDCYHNKKRFSKANSDVIYGSKDNSFMGHKFSKKELNNLYDDLDKVKLV